MLSNQDKNRYTDYMGRIISLAVSAKFHLELITDKLAKSDFVNEMELGENSIIYNMSPYEIFRNLFCADYVSDNSSMNYNDAYWCGYIYSNIFFECKKPFQYIALKLPLERLLNMYPVYHEMDISQVYNDFKEAESSETIMRLLLKKHGMSAAELSRKSGVPLRTIARFKEKDEYLYKGTFNNIHSIASVLREPGSLFMSANNS